MLGSLGLLRQLSALGRAGRAQTPTQRMSSPTFIKRNLKRLLPSDQQFFVELKDRFDQQVKNAREERDAQIAMFFAQYLPTPVNYRKEREVVSAFIMGRPKSHAGLDTDGMTLRVNGKEVATREQVNSRFVRVCPGKFGADATSRRAANAALDVLGAGLRISDRKDSSGIPGRDEAGHAFIHPRGHGGRVVSDNACYNVEVTRRIRDSAAQSLSPFSETEGAMMFLPPKVTKKDIRDEMFPGASKLTKAQQAKVKSALKARQRERAKAKKDAEKAERVAKKAQLARQASMREEISERAGDMNGLRRRRRRSRR